MTPPNRAIILAAGLGTRMRPLTLQRPKPLMPFAGKPLLQHAIDLLASWGVKHICINAHYHAAQLMKWVIDNPQPNLSLNLSYEPNILGTGGPLAKAHWFIHDQPFWLFNADVMAHCDPTPLLKTFAKNKPLAAWWMTDQTGPRTVETENGLVTNIASQRPGTPGTYTFTGLHLIHPRLLNYIPNQSFSSIITAYQHAMKQGQHIATATCPNSYWADLGQPKTYLAAHQTWHTYAKKHNLPTPKTTHTIHWDNTTLTPQAKPNNIIIGDRTTIWGAPTHVAVPASETLTPHELTALKKTTIKTNDAMAEFLPPRPSQRELIRVQRGRHSAILIRYNPDRTENTLYVPLTRRLSKAGLNVPHIIAHHPKKTFTLMQDLGRTDLQHLLKNASPTKTKNLYKKALDQTLLLHQHGIKACKGITLQPKFDAKLYRWEHHYFAQHLLQQKLHWTKKQIRPFTRAAKTLTQSLLQGPQTIIHRDLQSTNILLHKNTAYLIDYQGLRLGHPAYDIASLLMDPYVSLPEEIQQELLAYYLDRATTPFPETQFWQAAIQRLLQALGAYARLGAIPATAHFQKHLTPGLHMLTRAIQHINPQSPLHKHLHSAIQTTSRQKQGTC